MDKAQLQENINRIGDFVRAKTNEANAKGAVIGISGGIDSALVLALLNKAYAGTRYKIMAVFLPISDPSQKDVDCIHELSKYLDIEVKTIDLELAHRALLQVNGLRSDCPKLVRGNLAARVRAVELYTLANVHNLIVAGTTNKTEMQIGYFTKFGDGACDIEPIAHLYKTEVWEMSRYLWLPQILIDRAPSAGLWDGQTDEGEIGCSYAELDDMLRSGNLTEEIKARVYRNAHKKVMPPGLEF